MEGGQVLGRPGGIQVEAMSESGHWVVICQRADGQELDMPTGPRGEPMESVALDLLMGERKERIDALLAQDRSGRYLVVLRESQAYLVDGIDGARWNLQALSPSLRSDRLVPHRSFAFADTHLLIVSDSAAARAFALPLPHLLADELRGSSSQLTSLAHPIEVGGRSIYRVEAGIGYATFTTLAEQSTERAWPSPASETPVHRCSSSASVYPAFSRLSSYHPDSEQEVAWLTLPPFSAEGSAESERSESPWQAEPVPGFVMASGSSWVRRLDSGRLMLVRGRTQRQLASERCGARILHGYGPLDTFLIACEEYEPVAKANRKLGRREPKYRFDLHLVRPGYVRSLNADVAKTGVDVKGQPLVRWFPIRPGASAALVDFQQAQLVELGAEARVIAVGAGGALIRRGDAVSLFLGADHPEENVDLRVADLDPVLTRGSVAVLGNRAFSLNNGLSAWRLPRAPLAISEDGHALIANEPAASDRWPRGPLLFIGPPSQSSPSSAVPSDQPAGLSSPDRR